MHPFRCTIQNEHGATFVFTALTIPVLVIFGALAMGVTSLWTAHHDVQRGVDLGALAGAASVPTVATDIPLDGLQQTLPLDGTLDPTTWNTRPCGVFQQQLTDGRSQVTNAFDRDQPSDCEQVWGFESPLLSVLAYCAEHALDFDSDLGACRDQFEQELRTALPLVSSLDASAMSAINRLFETIGPESTKLIDDTLSAQLGSACVDAVQTSVLGVTSWACLATFSDALALARSDVMVTVGSTIETINGTFVTINETIASIVEELRAADALGLLDPLDLEGIGLDPLGVPQISSIRPQDIAPALLTPLVTVNVTDVHHRPPFSPLSWDMSATATARRVIKSALVLPTLGVPGQADYHSLSIGEQEQLQAVLGPDAGLKVELAYELDSFVVPDDVLVMKAKELGDQVLDAIDGYESLVSTSVHDSGCASLPEYISCPIGDDIVNREHLFGPFMEDVRDASAPGPSPTVQEVLAEYEKSDQIVWVVSALRMVNVAQAFGERTLAGLTATEPVFPTVPEPPTFTPPPTNVSSLISPLMFIPAMDVVPASVVRDGDVFYLKRVSNVAAMTGLYKARLVK